MKIISLNLHCLQEDNLLEKLKRVAAFINTNDIDICLFQEVAQHKDSKVIKDNIREGNNCYLLREMLDYPYEMYFETKKLGFEVYEEGLAILSKKPLENKGFAYITKTTDYNNWLTRIALYGDYEGITFFNIHLGWTLWIETIEEQIDKVSERALNKDNQVMILGDFNCCFKSPQYQYFVNKGFYSAVELLNFDIIKNPSFNRDLDNGQKDNRFIDHVLMNKKMEILDFKVLFQDNPVSDHNMIYLEIKNG